MGVSPAISRRVLARLLMAVLLLFTVPARADDLSRIIRAGVSQDADLKRFYKLRRFRPAWTAATAPVAVAAMAAADAEGLSAADYRVDPVPSTKGRAGKGRARGAALAAWDINFTRTFLRYARDVRTGRLPPAAVYFDVELPPPAFDAPAALAAALEAGALAAFIADLPPPRAEYRVLRDALARYRSAAFDPVPVRPHQPLDRIAGEARDRLIARLAAEDPAMAPDASPDTFKAAVEAGLRRFQARFGLAPDGRLTEETVAALNRPAAVLAVQIEANMERWRWMPRTADPRYVEVNIADASLKAVEGGKAVLTSPVVLGQKDWLTPILATTARAVILNPPWHVPPEIASQEILPMLQRDARYLAAHNMVLVDGPAADPHGVRVKWRKVTADAFPYRIEQKPGPASGLGTLLFEMPNGFDVYLHDTPAKALFGRADRFLSHGCVRVKEIAALARWAAAQDLAPAPPGETARVALAAPLPIYLLYWTAFGDAGGLAFRPDVYELDLRLIAFLHGQGAKLAGRRTRSALASEEGATAP